MAGYGLEERGNGWLWFRGGALAGYGLEEGTGWLWFRGGAMAGYGLEEGHWLVMV